MGPQAWVDEVNADTPEAAPADGADGALEELLTEFKD